MASAVAMAEAIAARSGAASIWPADAGRSAKAMSTTVVANAVVKTTATIREDTVFVPFHWGGEQAANNLTNAALDPTSKMPEFKVCAVRLCKSDD